VTLVQVLSAYQSPQALLNPGDVTALNPTLATAMIAAGTAALYNDGAVEAQSYTRGLGASELPSQYTALGFTLGEQVPSAAVQGYLGETTILDGRAVPNALVGDKAQG
jgi:hypothetical protein